MLEKALNTVMPFKIIRFGNKNRKGRYTLSHKNSFLVRVQLLDNTVMECTLTVENTGQDCLNAVANRLDLKEVQYFGLQYYNKQMAIRWVELDKPLKKQVDKNAQDTTLFFRVMLYVANLELLQQEITRYLFYLQLKNNVIDGCQPRSSEEAIELASYMLQAEFGDYNPEVHTVQYFRDFILFPEVLAPNEETLDSLTKNTLSLHQRHRGLSPPDAELNYILKVMHLDGYGEECFLAKDSQNCDCQIGCSFLGVNKRELLPPSESQDNRENSSEQYSFGKVTLHEWNSIDHVLYNKAIITLNMRKDDTILQFHMEDVETAKYVCRIFELKRKFYSLNRQSPKKLSVENGEVSIQRRPTLRRTQETPIQIAEVGSSVSSMDQLGTEGSQLPQADFISSQENLQSYARQTEAQYYASQTSLDHAYVSQTSLNRVPGIQQEYGYANGYGPGGGSMYSSTSINSLGHSQTQLNQRSPASSNMSLSSERHITGNGVPVYRRTPDYDSAVQQRRRYSSYLENQAVARRQKQPELTEVQDGSLKPRPHSMIYSQQELLQQAIHGPHYAHYPPQNPPLHYHHGTPQMVDSASHLPASQTQLHRQFESSHESLPPMHGLVSQPNQHPGQYLMDVHQKNFKGHGNGGIPENAILAASTPDLANSIQQVKGYSGSEMQLLRHYTKPPPPYPRNNSTSTPDLSAHRQTGVSASTPDLHHGFSVAPGQRRTQFHPTLMEDGGYNPVHEQHEVDDFPPTVIRGVCTSVEGLHGSQQNVMPQRPQAAVQSVHAYLQELSKDQQAVSGGPRARIRHTGQQPNPAHHRPVSYPPRLNYANQILKGSAEESYSNLPPLHQPHTPLERSQTNSSTSTVGSYGSQQYLQQQHGSQISLQHAQLAPASHPILTQYHPTPQRAEIHVRGSSGGQPYVHHTQMRSREQYDDDDTDPDEENDVVQQDLISRDPHSVPLHSQMASNVTMVVHSSGSDNGSDSEQGYSSDENEPRADYRNAPITTIIDNWKREQPPKMYVPPKPKKDVQEFQAAGSDQEFRPPPPYPENHEDLGNTSTLIPVIPIIETSDLDPPMSYRKPDQMESFDEGDVSRVSVFPHPNPSAPPHSPKLSNTNPFYSSNPFYNPHDDVKNHGVPNMQNIFDFRPRNGSVEQRGDDDIESIFANAPSGELRNARRSTRKNAPPRFSTVPIEEVPSPSAGTPDDRVLQLEKAVEDGIVFTEFKGIPLTRTSTGEQFFKDPSGLRDRKSVLPYPENRVRVTETADNPEGYINASLVKIDVAGEKWTYIMCQNPLEDYMHEFWDMVWRQRVSIIAMISKEVEDNKSRCRKYWPELPGDSSAMLFGNYKVSSEVLGESTPAATTTTNENGKPARPRLGSAACENLSLSVLTLQRSGTTECRKIWHLQYHGWPDSGAPTDATDFLAFMEELQSVRILAHDSDTSQPVLVHCASGSGRSGVFVLCDLMRHSLEHNKTTTIPEMLKSLRQQRTNVIQTVSQYHFVYQVLILFLKNSRLI